MNDELDHRVFVFGLIVLVAAGLVVLNWFGDLIEREQCFTFAKELSAAYFQCLAGKI